MLPENYTEVNFIAKYPDADAIAKAVAKVDEKGCKEIGEKLGHICREWLKHRKCPNCKLI